MRRAVVYLRVSTIDQTTANQERELRDIAGRMGCGGIFPNNLVLSLASRSARMVRRPSIASALARPVR
jgi:DNA invertase Pin-like site-specific DNA recombinase